MKRVADCGGISMPHKNLMRLNITGFVLLLFCWMATSTQAQVVVYRVNAGGRTTQAADISYPDWSADEQEADDPPPIQFARLGTPSIYVNEKIAGDQTAGKNQTHVLSSITNPAALEDVFVTQRWDPVDPDANMIWSFPVSVEREYLVKLYFSEMFGEGLETREFDILINGVLEEDNFNILQVTGNNEKVGVEREYTVIASDETLEIEFVNQEAPAGGVLPAVINAIEIVDVNSVNQAPTIADIEDQVSLEGEEISLQVEAGDPDDEIKTSASIISYLAEGLPPGLSINEATGLISGNIDFDAVDTYESRVIVLDSGFPTAGAIMPFTWTVSNGDPFVSDPIEDFTRLHGDPADEIDLSTVFTDPLGGELNYTIEANNNQDVVQESLTGSMLTLSYSASLEGTADITVRASNDFEVFAEDQFSVTVLAAHPQALIQITPDGGLGASTFNTSEIVVENTSPGSAQIEQVTIDLSTALYIDLVFDPTGNAGDSGFKCLTPDTGAETTGFIAPANACTDPFSDENEGGFNVLTFSFDDFDPGEVFTLSVDADPTSIKGNTGVGDAGSVGGIEMIGATVTVDFSDGSSETNDMFYIAESTGGSETIVRSNPLVAPGLSVSGHIGSMVSVTDSDQTIVVAGIPGETVRLFQSDGRLNIEGVPGGGFDVEPFEANEAIGGVWEYTGVVGEGGTVNIPVDLRLSDKADGAGDGGLNHFMAIFQGDFPGRVSNKIIIELQTPSSVSLIDGWNMVGVSYQVSDASYDAIFGDATPVQAPYRWDNGNYVQSEEMTPGIGYWLDISNPGDVTILGTEITQVEVDVTNGWNLVSGPSCIFDIDLADDPGSIIVPGNLYRFDGSYVASTSLTPNVGYWLEVTADGTLTFNCDASVLSETERTVNRELAPHAAFGVLRISDEQGYGQDLYFGGTLQEEGLKKQYNMPPYLMRGFDARFVDNSRLMEGAEALVRVRGAEFPLSVELAANPKIGHDALFVEALAGDEVIDRFQLFEGSELVVSDERITTLRLTKDVLDEAAALPESFELSGNFPNPFNPTTMIVFDLPEDATMQVAVFDLLGRQVMLLDGIEMFAGAKRQVQVDAASLASGTYLYHLRAQMESGTVVSSGRMTLLK